MKALKFSRQRESIREDMEKLGNEPEEGWLSFTYKYVTHILYPDDEFSAAAEADLF